MTSDGDLLRRYAECGDEACFGEVVQRHIGFVYAVAVRRLGNRHSAEDAAQAVFVALARKARSVATVPSVAGWLHRSTCYETKNIMRAHGNRLAREAEAHRRGVTLPTPDPAPEAVAEIVDEVLCELSDADRDVVLARYFSQRSYAEIGTMLRLSENAARMRVDRALMKLRGMLQRRGLTSTAAALATALPAFATTSVPSALAVTVTKASVAGVVGGAAVSGAAITFMSTGKIITGIVAAAAVGAFVYVHERTTDLETDLALARADAAAATKSLRAVEQEVADLKRGQKTTSATISATGVVPAQTAPAPAQSNTPVAGVTQKAPAGWWKNGSDPEFFDVGVDANNTWGGMPSAYVRSKPGAEGKFGGMMQTISAEAFRGGRVRLTGWVKTEDVANSGHLWMRIDEDESGKALQFDNMHGRAPKGTTDWQEYSVVLDVPPESKFVNYGFFVSGEGKMWVNGLTITQVGQEVATTNLQMRRPALPKTPTNLGFKPGD